MPSSDTVEITVQYPADYYTIVPEKPVAECPVQSKQELETKIEERAKELVQKQEVRQKQEQVLKQKKALEQTRKEEASYQTYLMTRTELVRSMRREKGASVLGKDEEQTFMPKHRTAFEPKMQDSSYKAVNVLSSYPIDRSFILTEDRTVPAVLLDSINSQLGGTVRAYVSEDVFGADNRYKLLEKGDVVLGRYEPTKKVGETRINVSFYRIIRAADGAELYASGNAFAYAADKMGRAGLVGDVDNRNWERYGLAFGTSLIGGLAGIGKSKTKDDEYEEFWNRLSDNTTEITTKILEQYMNIAPVITIAQGEPILIRLSADITLKQPEEKEKQHF